MKYIIATALAALSIQFAAAQSTTVYVGGGVDTISQPRTVDVTLVEAGVLHRTKSGVLLNAWTQNGYPNNDLPNVNLTAAQLGYSARLGQFSPYALVGAGNRHTGTTNDYFYQAVAGTKYDINSKWFVDAQYRYRNSNTLSNFQTNRYLAGVGYNITKSVSVQANYAEIYGDVRSQQYQGYLAYRF